MAEGLSILVNCTESWGLKNVRISQLIQTFLIFYFVLSKVKRIALCRVIRLLISLYTIYTTSRTLNSTCHTGCLCIKSHQLANIIRNSVVMKHGKLGRNSDFRIVMTIYVSMRNKR